jgi:hypothetical protein
VSDGDLGWAPTLAPGFNEGFDRSSERRPVDCGIAIELRLDRLEQGEQTPDLDQLLDDHPARGGQILPVASLDLGQHL